MPAKRRSMAEFLNLAESGAPTVTDGLCFLGKTSHAAPWIPPNSNNWRQRFAPWA